MVIPDEGVATKEGAVAFLLELVQQDRRWAVGAFGSEADVLSLVRRLPGLHEEADQPGIYWLEPTEVPELTELAHRGWVIPVCRAAFSTYPSDGVIDVVWTEVQVFDDDPPAAASYGAGSVSVNGWVFGMADAVAHVRARERLFAEADAHYAARGQIAWREALGSQDGEYVAVGPVGGGEPDHLVFLLDPAAVALRAECPSFADFLSRYPDDLP